MFNLAIIQDEKNCQEIYNFIEAEYQTINGGNAQLFRHSSIYSGKAVINKLVKQYQFEAELNSSERQQLKQLIPEFPAEISINTSK